MARIKGSGREIIERTLKKFGPDKVTQFYAEQAKLRGEEFLKEYQLISSVRWLEMEMDEENNSLQSAAKLLFPNDPQRLRKLGLAMAEHGFSVFYKIFFSLPSLPNLFKKVAAQWSQMYDTGQASVENIEKQRAEVVIRDFPDLPNYLREYLSGFYEGLAKINGAKNPKVTHLKSDPNAWRWEVKWE